MAEPMAIPTLKTEVARACSVLLNQVETARVDAG